MPPKPEAPPPRRESTGARRNLVTEEAILDAARSILREGGYGGFSIEAVAQRARAGKPTIYRWWPTRADLLAAIHAGERALRTPEPDLGRLTEDLTEFARTVLGAWLSTGAGEALRGLIAEAPGSDAASAALRSTLDAALTKPSAAMIARAVRRREIEAADVDPLIELYCGYLIRRLVTGDLAEDRSTLARVARLLASGRGRK